MSAYVPKPATVVLVRDHLAAHAWVGPAVTHTVGIRQVIAAYAETLPPNVLMDSVTRADANVNAIATSLVVKSFGGPRDPDVPVRFPRIIVQCYAPSRFLARSLADMVGEVLHDQTLDTQGIRLVLMQSAMPIVDVEEPTKFPFADVHFNCVYL